MMGKEEQKILIGNAFPLSLIRRHRVVVEEIPVEMVRRLAATCGVVSFWGHENSRAAAETVLGASLRTETVRPVLSLDAEGFPVLAGHAFRDCYVLSPDYVENRRPSLGEEVPLQDIKAWHALRLVWE